MSKVRVSPKPKQFNEVMKLNNKINTISSFESTFKKYYPNDIADRVNERIAFP